MSIVCPWCGYGIKPLGAEGYQLVVKPLLRDDPASVERVRAAVEHAFEVTRQWKPMPTHSHLNQPFWDFDLFTAAIIAKLREPRP